MNRNKQLFCLYCGKQQRSDNMKLHILNNHTDKTIFLKNKYIYDSVIQKFVLDVEELDDDYSNKLLDVPNNEPVDVPNNEPVIKIDVETQTEQEQSYCHQEKCQYDYLNDKYDNGEPMWLEIAVPDGNKYFVKTNWDKL